MLLSMSLALVYGPLQIWVVCSPTRTIRFRTVLAGVLVGLSAAFPLSVAIEWAWVALVESLWWDGRTEDLVEWAGWTVNPFVEEVVRPIPLVVVLALLSTTRRQLAVADLVVLGTAIGSGYRLAEHLARHGHEVQPAFAGISNDTGWALGLAGFHGTQVVPFPSVWLRQWFPEGVQVDWFGLLRSPIGSYNTIAIWGALSGLAVGLWLCADRIPALSRRLAALGGGLLVLFVSLAHAQINAGLSGADWSVPALAAVRWLEPYYWAWPLVAAGVAMGADWWIGRSVQRDPTLGSVQLEPGRSDLVRLLRVAAQRPPVSTATVWSFVRTRRAIVNSVASPRSGSGVGGAPIDRSIDALEPVARQLRAQSTGPESAFWRNVVAARWAARRRALLAAARSPVAWMVGVLCVGLVVVPLVYLVVGTGPGGGDVQRWFEDEGSWLLVGATVVALLLAVAKLIAGARALRTQQSPFGDPTARTALAVFAVTGAAVSLLLALVRAGGGMSIGETVYDGLHGLDALGSLVWATGINAGLLTIAATNPTVGWPLLRDHHRFKSRSELFALLPRELQVLVSFGFGVAMSEGGQSVDDLTTHMADESAGRGDAHGDSGRDLAKIEARIREAQERLAELERTQGPKKEKDRLRRLIRNLRQAAERARKGETHGRRGRGQQG